MKKLLEIRKLVKDIDPGTSILDREGELLYKLAGRVPKGQCIVEIGSWLGRSTIWLAKGARPGVKVYAIDPHTSTDTHAKLGIKDTFREFWSNIINAELEEKVVPLKMTSKIAADRWWYNSVDSIGLLFIDGGHEYWNVFDDYLDWILKMEYKGHIAFHDTVGYKGPKEVVDKLVFKSFVWVVTDIVGQVVAARFEHGRPNWPMWIYWKVYSWLFLLATKLPKSIKERLK